MVRKIIWILVWILVCYFVFNSLSISIGDIQLSAINYNIWYIIFSLIIYLLQIFLLNICWVYTANMFGKFSYLEWIISFSKIWLGRYIPWKVVFFWWKMYYLIEKWIKKKDAIAAWTIENILSVLFGFFVAIVFLWAPWLEILWYWSYYLVFLLSAFIGLCILFILIWMYLKNEKIPFQWSKLLFLSSIYIIAFVLWWISFYFLLLACWIEISFIFSIWLINFASMIWMLAIIVPSWIWIKEWILTYWTSVFSSASLAASSSIIFRILTTFWDIIYFILVSLVKYIHVKVFTRRD